MKFEPPILFKEFCLGEAERLGCSVRNVLHRVYHGRYQLDLRRVNCRVIFVCAAVEIPKTPPILPGEITMKDFLEAEASRIGLTRSAVANRISRGKYSHLKLRRVNRRVVFVKL
jgi:hypothetical protein